MALEEYADEQDDFAQEREIDACIKAVDVDCDGKIGQGPQSSRFQSASASLLLSTAQN